MGKIIFRPVSIADRELITRYTLRGASQICDLAFANLFGWAERYNTSWAEVRNTLVIRFQSQHRSHPVFLMPVGSEQCNLSVCMQELLDLCKTEDYPLVLMGVGQGCREVLEEECPGMFYFISDEGSRDYIYLREKLCSLSGKSLQSKRNHINKFEKTYPDYQYEPISSDNIAECLALEAQWLSEQGSENGKEDEQRMIQRVLTNFDKLGVSGGLLRVDGQVIAFTIGSAINTNTYGIHIEKALRAYEGAGAMINKAFALTIPEQYTYINREEDLGVEGLRKAKLSYKPEYLIHKDTALLRHG